MNIAGELKLHASRELQRAMVITDQIDYLGSMPTATPKTVKLSDKAEDMLRFDLDSETETIRNYRQRVKQTEAVGHYAPAEQLRTIINQGQNTSTIWRPRWASMCRMYWVRELKDCVILRGVKRLRANSGD